MLKYVSSSLFESPAQTLVNAVNTVGIMGKGIAAEFKQRYPGMFERYARYCKDGSLDIGKLYLYRTPNKLVLNFPTKKHWKQPSKLEYIEAGLRKFVDTYEAHGIASISFPQLGCGNGGLSWTEVQPLMESYLKPLPIPVLIHLAERPGGFVPEHLSPEARMEALKARRSISFDEVWAGLWRAAGMPGDPPRARADEVQEALPPLRVRTDTGTVELPGQDVEALWTSLRLHGALPQTQFPGSLRYEADLVRELFLKLDFVRPISFISDTSARRKEPGLRFDPQAASEPTETFVAERV